MTTTPPTVMGMGDVQGVPPKVICSVCKTSCLKTKEALKFNQTYTFWRCPKCVPKVGRAK